MNSSRDKVMFWGLLAVQAAGSQFIIWSGIPIYKRLRSAASAGATPTEIALTFVVVVIMLAAHFLALRIRRRLRFGRNVLFGHVLVWIGELSLFFVAALASLIVFDRFGELEILWWKVLVLGSLLFAITSYKYLLMSLGESMIETEDE